MSLVDSTIKGCLLLGAVLLIAGCAAGGGGSKTEEPVADDGIDYASYAPEAGLTTDERFREALKLLEVGDPGQARAELIAFQAERPNSDVARDLIHQIDLPANKYFPEDYVTIDLESGESLSTLSKHYLGDIYKFYALAKYNDIEIARNIRVGQTIRIPLTVHAEQALAQDDAIEMDADKKKSGNTATKPTKKSTAESKPAKKQAIPEAALSTAELQSLVKGRDYEQAINLMEASSQKLDNEGEKLAATAYLKSADSLALTNRSLATHRYVKAGELLVKQGDMDKAVHAYKRANDLSPGTPELETAYTELQKQLTDKYHREASMAFRRQELDKAISIWDKVLKIDPDHANARIYRAQAIELKKKLSELE